MAFKSLVHFANLFVQRSSIKIRTKMYKSCLIALITFGCLTISSSSVTLDGRQSQEGKEKYEKLIYRVRYDILSTLCYIMHRFIYDSKMK